MGQKKCPMRRTKAGRMTTECPKAPVAPTAPDMGNAAVQAQMRLAQGNHPLTPESIVSMDFIGDVDEKIEEVRRRAEWYPNPNPRPERPEAKSLSGDMSDLWTGRETSWAQHAYESWRPMLPSIPECGMGRTIGDNKGIPPLTTKNLFFGGEGQEPGAFTTGTIDDGQNDWSRPWCDSDVGIDIVPYVGEVDHGATQTGDGASSIAIGNTAGAEASYGAKGSYKSGGGSGEASVGGKLTQGSSTGSSASVGGFEKELVTGELIYKVTVTVGETKITEMIPVGVVTFEQVKR